MLRNLIGKLRSFMIKLKYFKSKTLEYSYSDTVLSGRKIMLRHFPVSQLREHWEDTSTKVKISSKKLCLPSLTSFHYLREPVKKKKKKIVENPHFGGGGPAPGISPI